MTTIAIDTGTPALPAALDAGVLTPTPNRPGRRTDDHREAARAFVEKRGPVLEGR